MNYVLKKLELLDLKGYEDIDDLKQEIRIKVFLNLGKVRRADFVQGWIKKVSKNAAMDRLRRKYRAPAVEEIQEVFFSNFEDRVDSHMELQKVWAKAGKHIPNCFLEVFKLFMSEMTYEEIAEELDISIGTVKSRLHRAKTRLKKILKENN